MRQLSLPPLIWNVSHLKIFPLELLGPAIGLSAAPSSSKGKILRWDTTTNSPNNKQMSHIRCDTTMICFRVSFIFSLQCAYLNVCIMHSVHTLYRLLTQWEKWILEIMDYIHIQKSHSIERLFYFHYYLIYSFTTILYKSFRNSSQIHVAQ